TYTLSLHDALPICDSERSKQHHWQRASRSLPPGLVKAVATSPDKNDHTKVTKPQESWRDLPPACALGNRIQITAYEYTTQTPDCAALSALRRSHYPRAHPVGAFTGRTRGP